MTPEGRGAVRSGAHAMLDTAGSPGYKRALRRGWARKKLREFLVLLLDGAVSEGLEAAPHGPPGENSRMPGA